MMDVNTWRVFAVAIIVFSSICSASTCISSHESSCSDGVPYERAQFNQLLASNVNHFGNSPESGQQPITILAKDTSYEQLECLGFNPALNILSATIEVKLPDGFGGGLCTNGSLEYVRFWVNYGTAWDGIGYVTLNTHDIPDTLDCNKTLTKPLFYTLSINFEPKHQNCSIPVLPAVRATLSWNQLPPDDPFWSPVWGNTVQEHIQSLPTRATGPKVYTSGIDIFPALDEDAIVLSPPEKCRELEEDGISVSANEDVLSPDPEVQSTGYEGLTCLGLDWSLSALVATVRIKRPRGYNAPPCKDNRFEYVSFWADFNNTCNYTFLGTVKFNVHDYFEDFPRAGLAYTAILPVDLRNFSAPCNVTKIGRIRAALAFDHLPPTPPTVARRGNYLETHVHLQPYTGVFDPLLPHIRSIGNVPLQSIETSALATGVR
jgi:hypothetical protein